MISRATLFDARLPASVLGESPLWDERDQVFYWTDIVGCKIHRFAFLTQVYDFCITPSPVGFVVLEQQGRLLAGLEDGLYTVDFEGGVFTKISSPPMPQGGRFNDGKCDPQGRLWAGTMHKKGTSFPTPLGCLFRYEGRDWISFEKDMYIPNGMGWSPDGRVMYFTETEANTVWAYDVDPAIGTPQNKRVFHHFGDGHPDGLCVDSAGFVYSARFGDGKIEVFTPGGVLAETIELPAPQVTSCSFGGDDLKTLLITTASESMDENQLKKAPLSGQVFTLERQVPGLPAARFRFP